MSTVVYLMEIVPKDREDGRRDESATLLGMFGAAGYNHLGSNRLQYQAGVQSDRGFADP